VVIGIWLESSVTEEQSLCQF